PDTVAGYRQDALNEIQRAGTGSPLAVALDTALTNAKQIRDKADADAAAIEQQMRALRNRGDYLDTQREHADALEFERTYDGKLKDLQARAKDRKDAQAAACTECQELTQKLTNLEALV